MIGPTPNLETQLVYLCGDCANYCGVENHYTDLNSTIPVHPVNCHACGEYVDVHPNRFHYHPELFDAYA